MTCITNLGKQNWVLGLLRSPTLNKITGTWEQFIIEPTIIPWKKYGCAIQYHRLFTDGENIFLSFWINDFDSSYGQMQIFQMKNNYTSLPIIAQPIH